ncbi:MAG: Citrate transporter, partial [Chloroflexota bacterium]|nr:Citrate transporter [Chloroflexota bacterium]
GISPVPLLMAEALLSNVGGVATLVGDPPNVVIGSAAGFTFGAFLTHLAPIVLAAWPAALFVLWLTFRRELATKPKNIEALLGLNEREALEDPASLRKILIVLGIVILLFFLHSALHLKPATIALAGAAAALLWVRPDVEDTLRHVEWGVLLFFSALFVAAGGLEAAGVLRLLADAVAGPANANLLGASLLLLWIAALASAVVDNIPFTIALIPVIHQLESLGITVAPLWWALALGAGFGGNGTPIGATANVITVALSAKTRTPITLRIWLRSGLPVMLVTCIIASLLFALFFGWMSTP